MAKRQENPVYVGIDLNRPRSFSSLTLFEQCPRAFMFSYCMAPAIPTQDNAHAQYGHLAHTLLEEWARDEMLDADLAPEWEKRYRTIVTLPFPKSTAELEDRLYQAGLSYFSQFHGFGDEWDVLSVEERFHSRIDGFLFTGIADLLLRHRDTGRLMAVDHKSKSAASMKRDLNKCYKQLYLYCGMVREKYGEYPSVLSINAFRCGELYSTPFCLEEHRRTTDWATDVAAQILVESEFPRREEWYFCSFICSHRAFCRKDIAKNGVDGRPFGIDV